MSDGIIIIFLNNSPQIGVIVHWIYSKAEILEIIGLSWDEKKRRLVTKAMIMYKLVMHMDYQSWVLSIISCIDLYNCQFDFRWCFNDDFHLYFSANDKIKDIKSKPKNTAQMVRHVYIIVILRKPINEIKM